MRVQRYIVVRVSTPSPTSQQVGSTQAETQRPVTAAEQSVPSMLALGRKRSAAGGFVSGGQLDLDEKVELGKRVAIESHWEQNAGQLGGGQSEKFLKLLGARKKQKPAEPGN